MGNFVDRTGDKVGGFVVIERAPNNKHKQTMWLCRCKCGKYKTINATSLSKGVYEDCGCGSDLVNQTFGRLLVIERCEGGKLGASRWRCVCECGNEVIVQGGNLKTGHTKSCGCYNLEVLKRRSTVHGLYNHKFAKRAHDILTRCNSPKHKSYKDYGERGVKCLLGDTIEEIIPALESIDGYFEGAQIDRIDNDGHYEIGNLRWVTASENMHNQRTIVITNTSGVKGVSYSKYKKKWIGYMAIRHKKHKRQFNTFEDAVWYRYSLEEYYHLKQFIKKEDYKWQIREIELN